MRKTIVVGTLALFIGLVPLCADEKSEEKSFELGMVSLADVKKMID